MHSDRQTLIQVTLICMGEKLFHVVLFYLGAGKWQRLA